MTAKQDPGVEDEFLVARLCSCSQEIARAETARHRLTEFVSVGSAALTPIGSDRYAGGVVAYASVMGRDSPRPCSRVV